MDKSRSCGRLRTLPIIYLVVVLVSVAGLTAGKPKYNTDEPKYVILGAGVSGIAAARALVAQGEENFLILEGSNRIGGRLKSGSIGGKTVELGSPWIEGGGPDDPVFKLAEETSLTSEKVDFNDVVVLDENGNDVTGLAVERWDVFDDSLSRLYDLQERLEFDAPHIPDLSQRDALSLYGWRPQDATDYALEYFDMDYTYGHGPETASTRYSFYPNYGGYEERLVLDQRGGLSKIAGKMAVDIPGFEVDDPRLRLNTKVTSICYTDSEVLVTTEAGQTISAHYAIVTFSLGVLKSHDITFDPPLPEWKRFAIQSATFVTDYAVYLKFPNTSPPFWTDTEFTLYGSPRRGHFSVWHNLEKRWPGSRILKVQLSGAEGERVARLESDAAVLDEAMLVLRKMYGERIPQAQEILVPRWLTDPLHYGTYSDWSPAFPVSSHDALRAPVGRVYFAGEAYDKNWFGYIQGAVFSARATVASILECDQDSTKCEQYVPPYQARGCTYKQATNYDRTAQVDDGSCSLSGDHSNVVTSLRSSHMSVLAVTSFVMWTWCWLTLL